MKRLQSQKAGCTHSPPLKQENKSAREMLPTAPDQQNQDKTHTSSPRYPGSKGPAPDRQPLGGHRACTGPQNSPFSDGNSGCSLRASAFSSVKWPGATGPGLQFPRIWPWIASKTTRPRLGRLSGLWETALRCSCMHYSRRRAQSMSGDGFEDTGERVSI